MAVQVFLGTIFGISCATYSGDTPAAQVCEVEPTQEKVVEKTNIDTTQNVAKSLIEKDVGYTHG